MHARLGQYIPVSRTLAVVGCSVRCIRRLHCYSSWKSSGTWPLGLILIVNLVWAAAYSGILIQYRYTHSPSGLKHLELLCWAAMAVNIGLLLIRALPYLRTSNFISSKLQLLLLLYMPVGMGLTATAFQTSSYSLELFDFAGWVLFAAVLVNLVNSMALARTLRHA